MTQGRRRDARPPRVDSWPARVRRLEAEVDGLRRAIRTRGLIEQAKGRLIERLGLDPDEAFRYLAQRSQDTNLAVADVAADLMGADVTGAGPDLAAGTDDVIYRRRAVRLRVAIGAASEPAELLEALAEADWLGAGSVALFGAEADGALRLLAATGWPASVSSDWRWVPSAVRTPAAEAIRRAEPLWLSEPDGLTVIGGGHRVAALPIRVGSSVVAALEVGFPGGSGFPAVERRHLLAAAEAVATWLASARLDDTEIHAGAPDRWVEAVVEASLTPAAVLSPVWTDAGLLDDFWIDYANGAAIEEWATAGSPVGRRLLDVAPDLAADGRFDAYARALPTGADPAEPDQAGMDPGLGFRAARVGRRLVVAWHAKAAASDPAAPQATATRLATERVRSAMERAQTEELRAAFFPPPLTRRRHGPLLVAALHVAPSGVASFRGDFYEISRCDDELMVTVGDVFGSGVPAAHTMVRLRHAVRVLGFGGLAPADVLRLTNLELAADEDPPLASLVLARIGADGQTVRWAQAGHFSPILVRAGRARSLRRPAGGIVGLTPGTRYLAATVHLEPRDMLVFYTDGVLQGWPGSPIRQLAAECERAQAGGGAEELLQRFAPQEDEACLVVVEWLETGR